MTFDARTMLPLAAIGVAGYYIYTKYRTERGTQEMFMESLRRGEISPNQGIKVGATQTTFYYNGKPYTIDNRTAQAAAQAVGTGVSWLIGLFTGGANGKRYSRKEVLRARATGDKETGKGQYPDIDAMSLSEIYAEYATFSGPPMLGAPVIQERYEPQSSGVDIPYVAARKNKYTEPLLPDAFNIPMNIGEL